MKMDTKGIDPRIILSERFRSAQEVMDHGFQIVGSGITFPGDGVKFDSSIVTTDRLNSLSTPNRAMRLTEFSAHTSFTPEFSISSGVQRHLWTQDPNYGFCAFTPGGVLYIAVPGGSNVVNISYANWSAAIRLNKRNWMSYSIKNGEQNVWLNGVLIGSGTANVMPPANSALARPLYIGNDAKATPSNPWHGTIHQITWLNTTMTIEDHLDFMHNDTYSEIF